jgi:hypothetical protein
MGKPGSRRDDAVDLFQIWNWKAAARKREGWRKKITEARNQWAIEAQKKNHRKSYKYLSV